MSAHAPFCRWFSLRKPTRPSTFPEGETSGSLSGNSCRFRSFPSPLMREGSDGNGTAAQPQSQRGSGESQSLASWGEVAENPCATSHVLRICATSRNLLLMTRSRHASTPSYRHIATIHKKLLSPYLFRQLLKEKCAILTVSKSNSKTSALSSAAVDRGMVRTGLTRLRRRLVRS